LGRLELIDTKHELTTKFACGQDMRSALIRPRTTVPDQQRNGVAITAGDEGRDNAEILAFLTATIV
jgi:hypothetical protein